MTCLTAKRERFKRHAITYRHQPLGRVTRIGRIPIYSVNLGLYVIDTYQEAVAQL